MLNDPNIEIFDEIERTYLEFDDVLERLGSGDPTFIPPWVSTSVMDSKYFETDQILERLKYENRAKKENPND